MTGTVLAAIIGLTITLGCPTICRILPAPDDEPTSPYLTLATWRFATATGLLATALSWLVTQRIPAPYWPIWLVISSVGVLAVCIDHATCWLPKTLTHTSTAIILTALPIVAVSGHLPWSVAGRALLAGLAARSLFWVLWRLGAGLGFGDVRLVLVCGIGAGLFSWPMVLVALFAATLLALVLAVTIYRGRRAIPYGPGLLIGTVLACALL
ncbi:prepilin peptidase [Luteococcus sp.]|uniref:prepilin peptidase n=1 Tax=Luteococcus sp. TaxID=1969402 RepID=UPI0037359B2C